MVASSVQSFPLYYISKFEIGTIIKINVKSSDEKITRFFQTRGFKIFDRHRDIQDLNKSTTYLRIVNEDIKDERIFLFFERYNKFLWCTECKRLLNPCSQT